jgi:hypothetical protein
MITESDQIANALDDAAQRWPAGRGNRSKPLLRLRAEGHRALRDQRAQDVVIRRGAVCRISGALAGVFGDSYLTTVREDWPA